MLVIKVLAGVLLLVLGRKLFWLYIAVLGFVAGLTVASSLFQVQQVWLQLVIGIAFGIIGALLAYFFQYGAIAVAGFLGGAYIAISLATGLGQSGAALTWVLFFVGGIIGAILMVMLFDWALIILSSLAGALLVTEGLHLTGPIGWLIAGGLLILGIVIQANLERPPRPARKNSTT
jgi:hypothetical protein